MIRPPLRSAILFATAFALAGCEWDDWYSPGDGFVDETPTVVCAELRNSGDGACAALPEADEDAAEPHLDPFVPTVVFDAGTLYRGAALELLVEIDNPGEAIWNGHLSASFDAGCADPNDRDIITLKAVTLGARGTLSLHTTVTCTEMPLGERTLTIQLHDPDPEDVLAQTVILFDLDDGEPPP